MGIAYGTTTSFQATKASLQDDILINIDGAASEVVGTTIYDLSGQNINGTLTNDPTFNKGFGGYFSFDGTDDRIETSYTTALGTGDYTYEAWIRYTATQVGAIIGKRASTSSYEQLSLFVANNNTGGEAGTRIAFYERASNVRSSVTSSSYGDGNWHHAVLVRDYSSGNFLYVDNQLVASNTTSHSSGQSQTPPIIFGANADGDSPYSGRITHFNGDIAVMKVYNRALTAAEVSKNFNVMRHRFGI